MPWKRVPSRDRCAPLAAAPELWNDAAFVGTYLELRPAVPGIAALEALAAELLSATHGDRLRFIDLGCGDGSLAERVLAACPNGEAILVDFSAPMLERAGRRFGHDSMVRLVRADLRAPDLDRHIPRRSADAVVTAFTWRWLSRPERTSVVRFATDLLEPGGVFVNLEEFDFGDRANSGLWQTLCATGIQKLRARQGITLGREEAWAEHDAFAPCRPPRVSIAEHLEQLNAAGFTNACLAARFLEAGIVMARKP